VTDQLIGWHGNGRLNRESGHALGEKREVGRRMEKTWWVVGVKRGIRYVVAAVTLFKSWLVLKWVVFID
jgi:hypothetical protein